MKKVFATLMCLAAICSAFAQTPECKTAYEAAKAKDDAFNKAQAKLMINRNDASVDKVQMSEDLLGAYEGYLAVLPLDQIPNEKGQVKPKYTKKIYDSLKKHASNGDFINAGIEMWNAQKLYPEAYNSFVIGAELVRNPEVLGVQGQVMFPDTVVAVWYYNAGNCAFNVHQYEKAAEAYNKAIDMGYDKSDAYKYLMSVYQNIKNNIENDEAAADKVQNEIYNVAEKAYQKFGSSDTYLFNNYINRFFQTSDYNGGLGILNKEIAANPDNGNLYNLRALFYRELNNNEARLADLMKAGELCSDSNTLTDVAAEMYRAGQKILAENNGDTPEAKAKREEVKTILLKAKDVTDKAKAANNGQSTSKLDDVIDTINYGLETFF